MKTGKIREIYDTLKSAKFKTFLKAEKSGGVQTNFRKYFPHPRKYLIAALITFKAKLG